MAALLYEDLTKEVIGIAFKVYNALGYGVRESYVHRAFAHELQQKHIAYQHEVSIPLVYDGERIGDYRLDFIVGGSVIVEIKVIPVMRFVHVKQVLEYLRATKKRLALLIFFTQDGVKVKRIVLPEKHVGIRSKSARSAQ